MVVTQARRQLSSPSEARDPFRANEASPPFPSVSEAVPARAAFPAEGGRFERRAFVAEGRVRFNGASSSRKGAFALLTRNGRARGARAGRGGSLPLAGTDGCWLDDFAPLGLPSRSSVFQWW
jgi:hypothetical protein